MKDLKLMLLTAFLGLAFVFVGSLVQSNPPTAQKDYGTPSYLDERTKGLYYGMVINYTEHRIQFQILKPDGTVILSTRELQTENWDASSWEGVGSVNRAPHIFTLHLAKGNYTFKFRKYCHHNEVWHDWQQGSFIIGDKHLNDSEGPFTLEIHNREKEKGCCDDS